MIFREIESLNSRPKLGRPASNPKSGAVKPAFVCSSDANLSFHSLRRTATTLLHEAGVPPTVAQALIGQDSEEVHRDYIWIGSETLRNAVNRFPRL
jgi:integrase